MCNFQTYDPDQDDYEKKYCDLLKRVGTLERKLAKMEGTNETEMEWEPDAVEGMTDKWVFDQLTTISECLKLIVENGKRQTMINEHVGGILKGVDLQLSANGIKETKDGYVFSDLDGPDDGLHTVGSNDPAKTKVNKKKLVDSAAHRTVSPTTVYGGGARDFWIDIDKLHQIANLTTIQGYNWPTIRIDDLGADLVFAKQDKTETIRLDALIGVSPK